MGNTQSAPQGSARSASASLAFADPTNAKLNNLGRVGQQQKSSSTPKARVMSLIAAHRCFLCHDLMVPKPFHPSKADRTCAICRQIACNDCFRSMVKPSKSLVRIFKCTLCLASRQSLQASVVVSLKALLTVQRPGTPCLLELIGSFLTADGSSQLSAAHPTIAPLLRLLWKSPSCGKSQLAVPRATASALSRVRAKSRSLSGNSETCSTGKDEEKSKFAVVEIPTVAEVKFQDAIRELRCSPLSDRNHSDVSPRHDGGSPRAKIPDFSEALQETSGRIFAALLSEGQTVKHSEKLSVDVELPASRRTVGAAATSNGSFVAQSKTPQRSTMHSAMPSFGYSTPSPLPKRMVTVGGSSTRAVGDTATKSYLAPPASMAASAQRRQVSASPLMTSKDVNCSPCPVKGSALRRGSLCPAPSMSPAVRRQVAVGGNRASMSPSPCPKSMFVRTDSTTVSAIRSENA